MWTFLTGLVTDGSEMSRTMVDAKADALLNDPRPAFMHSVEEHPWPEANNGVN